VNQVPAMIVLPAIFFIVISPSKIGSIFFLFGFVVFALSLIYWKLGSTPLARAMFIPPLVVGVLCMAGGLGLNFNNQSRIVEYQEAYSENPQKFVESE